MKKIVLCGKSCSGKTSLKNEFVKLGYIPSVSCTTRDPRPGEIDGIDYYFISPKEFEEKIKNDEFLEYESLGGTYYGTLKDEYDRCDVMILTPNAINKFDDRLLVFVIYLDTPYNVRILRGIDRGDSAESIQDRFLKDEIKFEAFNDYDVKLEISKHHQFVDFVNLIRKKND